MEITKFFCLLVMPCLTRGIFKYDIFPNGTVWLGKSISLCTEEIPDIKTPIIWESNNNEYNCDTTCSNATDFAITNAGNISTLSIKNVSWEFSTWLYFDANFNFGVIELEINVKPKIEIMNETDCVYNVTAQCSLPLTYIQCFLGKVPLIFTSNRILNCSDGKTFTNSAKLILNPPVTGKLKCNFTMDNLFSDKRTTKIKCDNVSSNIRATYNRKQLTTPQTSSVPNVTSGCCIFRTFTNLLLGVIIADILFKN